MQLPHVPKQNRLLATLTDEELDGLAPHLDLVLMSPGQVLCEPGKPAAHVHFPINAIVSALYCLADGAATEATMIGNEGAIGVPPPTGNGAWSSHAAVLGAGFGFRLSTRILTERFERDGSIMQLLLGYMRIQMNGSAQIATRNRGHSVERRLCRWLLLGFDRLQGRVSAMPEELIAGMLGTPVAGVAEAACTLRAAGLIRYSRGQVTLLDRAGLQGRVCECYEGVRRELDHPLPAEAHRARVLAERSARPRELAKV